jgi:hypothetical protein
MRTSVSPYYRHRFPLEIISHNVWLYFRFALSFRDVKKKCLAMRGISLSYETVLEWCLEFGQTYAKGLRRRSPRMKYSSRSKDAFITYGEQWTRMVTYWTSWSRAEGTRRQQRSSFTRLRMTNARRIHGKNTRAETWRHCCAMYSR